MGTLLFILFLVVILTVVVFVVVWQHTRRPYELGKLAIAAIGGAKSTYNLDYAVVDPAGPMIGLRSSAKQIVARTKDGYIFELHYDALRSISLTPVICNHSESSGEVSTRRGSQLIGAGLGGVVAGPLGAVVGGLTGGQRQQTSTTTTTSTGDLEMELFFRDDCLPRFALHAGSPAGEASVMIPELGEAFKDMAARLANIIDAHHR